jgi:murein DD-endopeptidase MepM/ murein hydrolase activator NlpD
MADTNHFYYDPERCEFVPVHYERKKRTLHNLSFWLINGIVLASIGIAILSYSIGTPAEIALKAENQVLMDQLEVTKSSIVELESRLNTIAELDNEMYRSVLGLDPIPYEERMAGTGGADVYSEFDLYSEDASEILRWTASKLDNLERRMNIQKLSFEEVKAYYNENQERMSHLPAIRPLSGILLSGYGMRVHPVLKYQRLHEGADFRADIGTEVFSTGEGVVKYAGRRGTYGNLLEIDHGFGYTTRYAHLSGFAEGIRAGAKVSRGQLVAYTGNTGVSEGPHLHYEVRVNGRSVDPLNYLFADITPEEFQMYREISEKNPMSMD